MREGARTAYRDYVRPEAGTVDREIFSDPDIYQQELERIFARAWNFMCHESQIPEPGDYFVNYIGEESVIATRDKTGTLQVFLNTCRHRGNAVCRTESGNTKSFLCIYHGWTYGLDGKLIGVPGFKDLYHGDLDREQWGLIGAGKVQSYKGFVFATMDPEAPDLTDYLGDVGRLSLDLAAEKGDMMVVEGVQKNVIDCNWKLAVDNLFDWYHVQLSHASAVISEFIKPHALPPEEEGGEPGASAGMHGADPYAHRVLLGEYGHGISGPRFTPEMRRAMERGGDKPEMWLDERWRDEPSVRAALGEVGRDTRGHPNIFPNLWVASAGTQLSLRLPKGPGKTEVWWFTMVDRNKSQAEQEARSRRGGLVFGPAGMLEQDDGENWEQSTRQTRGVIARRYPLNFGMNLGRGVPTTPAAGPRYIDAAINEHAQLWTYRAWAEWMDAEDWGALKQQRSPVPSEAV